MLKHLNKLIGAFNIRLKQIIQDIRAAFKSKDIEQRIQQDASLSTKLDHMTTKNLRDAAKLDTKAHIQRLLETPQGQKMKAEAMIRTSEMYLEQITLKLNQTPPEEMAWRMVMMLALTECTETIQRNEKILNLIRQFNGNETF